MKHKFTACKYLDYEHRFHRSTKQMLGNGKVFWMRDTGDPALPCMVQFCKKRGRLNTPESCTNERYACCRLYEEHTHEVQEEEIQ